MAVRRQPGQPRTLGPRLRQGWQPREGGEIIERLKRAEKGYLHAYEIAFICAALGEKELAFEWLAKAYQQRDRGLIHLKIDHYLDPLRSDSRFQDLLRRLNFPEEQHGR